MENATGNNCGHSPTNPCFFEEKKSNRPNILKIAQDRLMDFYHLPGKFLTKLRFANGQDSQQRSERREAISSALQVILSYTDLDTLQVGSPQKDGSIMGIQLGFINKKIGVHVKRIYRALMDLQICGYLKIEWRRLKKFGNYLTIHKLILFPSLFHHLDISQLKLNMSQHYKRKSIAKKAKQEAQAPMTQQQRVTGQANVARLRSIVQNVTNNVSLKQSRETRRTAYTEKYYDDRLYYYQQLQTQGFSMEEAKAKADGKYPVS